VEKFLSRESPEAMKVLVGYKTRYKAEETYKDG
jgi:hypothetical protein